MSNYSVMKTPYRGVRKDWQYPLYIMLSCSLQVVKRNEQFTFRNSSESS